MADIPVRVTPKSSRNAIVVEGQVIRVYVTAPPADNEANKAVIELLAKHLGISKSRVEINRGHASRHKVISVPEMTLMDVLQALPDSNSL